MHSDKIVMQTHQSSIFVGVNKAELNKNKMLYFGGGG
jgi:hypothetical protein